MINSNEKTIWQFVTLEQFSVPKQQTSKSLHSKWKTLWQWLRQTAIGNHSPKPEKTYDSSSLRYLAETGIVRETKVSKQREIRLSTNIFAAANSAKAIPKEILSRFWCFTYRSTLRRNSYKPP